MKKVFFKPGIIFLIMLLTGAGCEKDNEYEEIPLEYTKCPCEQETSLIKKINLENVLLYDISKISFEEMKELSFDGERSLFASYSPEGNSITLYSIRATMMGIGHVCNVPKKAKEWKISFSGDYISFSADEFESCDSQGAIAANTYSDYVLTTLKRKVK